MRSNLWITKEHMSKFSNLTGNYDEDKLKQYIKIAQDVEVQQVLGTKLFQKIDDDIQAASLTGVYETLVTTYVQPMLIHYAMADLLQFEGYEISNAGIVRNNPEDTVLPDKKEIDSLVSRRRMIADQYRERLVAHLCYTPSTYPEYTQSQEDGEYPNRSELGYTTPWNID
jgi:hypothetical protein